MSTTDEHDGGNVPDRRKLGFARAVEEAFSFLVDNFGFELVESDVTYVRYESHDLFLNVYHGRKSYEIEVEVGRLHETGGRRYRLREVLRALLGEPGRQNAYFLQSSSPEGVRRCVETAASLVKRHYAPVLTGDSNAFDRVAEFTSMLNEEYTRAVVQQPVRDAAERAWHAKDFFEVARLYRSIRQSLTRIERKRLEHAEKHLVE